MGKRQEKGKSGDNWKGGENSNGETWEKMKKAVLRGSIDCYQHLKNHLNKKACVQQTPWKKISESIIELVVWFFFVIIYAYYGGALTMFFTNEPTLPFKTVTDALNTVPEWRVLLIKSGGGNFDFKEKARQVILFCISFL